MSAERNHPSRNRTQTFLRPPMSVSKTYSATPKTFAMRYPWLQTGFERADHTPKKMTTFEGGQGLLCNTTWGEVLDRELAAQRAREREYDERHQSLRRMLR